MLSLSGPDALGWGRVVEAIGIARYKSLRSDWQIDVVPAVIFLVAGLGLVLPEYVRSERYLAMLRTGDTL